MHQNRARGSLHNCCACVNDGNVEITIAGSSIRSTLRVGCIRLQNIAMNFQFPKERKNMANPFIVG